MGGWVGGGGLGVGGWMGGLQDGRLGGQVTKEGGCCSSFAPGYQGRRQGAQGTPHSPQPLLPREQHPRRQPAPLPRPAAQGRRRLGGAPALVSSWRGKERGVRSWRAGRVVDAAGHLFSMPVIRARAAGLPLLAARPDHVSHGLLGPSFCPACRYGERAAGDPGQTIFVERKVHRERYTGELRWGPCGMGGAGRAGWGMVLWLEHVGFGGPAGQGRLAGCCLGVGATRRPLAPAACLQLQGACPH